MTTEQQQQTIAQFIEREQITMKAERLTREAAAVMMPNWFEDAHAHTRDQADRTYWLCTLEHAGQTMTVPFSEGSSAWWTVRGPMMHRRRGEANLAVCDSVSHDRREPWPCPTVLRQSWAHDDCKPTPPSVADLLGCLSSEASSYEQARDFADFCSEFGYDTDSRKAEREYHGCGETAKKLRALLVSSEAYDAILWNTERN